MNRDARFLARAYEIASKVDPHVVAPGVRVGCVITKDQRSDQEPVILAEGVHEYFGGPHAEVNALNKLKNLRTKEHKNSQVPKFPSSQVFNGCNVYITLEPCDCFEGKKTPSCVDLLIQSKPKKVVLGALDPRFAGSSVEKLKAAGIEVVVSSQQLAASRDLNPFYEHHLKSKRPWMTLKLGQSLDGRIVAASSQHSQVDYITNRHSLAQVHLMRARYSAMLTTTETILQDDPRMDFRPQQLAASSQPLVWKGSDPILIILGQREIPKDYKVWKRVGAIHGFESLDAFLCSDLYPKLDSIMTECGTTINSLLLERNLVDELQLFIAPKVLGSGKMGFNSQVQTLQSPDLGEGFHLQSVCQLGSDMALQYVKNRP